MLSVRVNNVDVMVLPLGGHADHDKASMKALKDMFLATTGAKYGKKGFEFNGIASFRGRSARVPTSVGMGMKIKRTGIIYGKVSEIDDGLR
jgi:hypothetical protein